MLLQLETLARNERFMKRLHELYLLTAIGGISKQQNCDINQEPFLTINYGNFSVRANNKGRWASAITITLLHTI